MPDPKRKGLGRGLGALIGPAPGIDFPGKEPATRPELAPLQAVSPAPVVAKAQVLAARPVALSDGSRLIELDPHVIQPNPKQPRHEFGEESLLELAESIRKDGVQEPVIVRQRNGEYQLVSGERRVRASILAERALIPCVVREVSDHDMLKLGLIENIQREDLNPIETAIAYRGLIDEFKWTQEQLAEQVGKKRVTVTNMLRLLNLPEDVRRHVLTGEITMGHARALLALETPAKQSAACRKIIEGGLSVRQAEKLAQPAGPKAKSVPSGAKDANVADIEDSLRRRFGTRVTMRTNPDHRGRIEIEFFNLDDLERILRLLRG